MPFIDGIWKRVTPGKIIRWMAVLVMVGIQLLPLFPIHVRADEPVKKVQIVEGEIEPYGHGLVFKVKDLKTLDRLYVYVHTETGESGSPDRSGGGGRRCDEDQSGVQ